MADSIRYGTTTDQEGKDRYFEREADLPDAAEFGPGLAIIKEGPALKISNGASWSALRGDSNTPTELSVAGRKSKGVLLHSFTSTTKLSAVTGTAGATLTTALDVNGSPCVRLTAPGTGTAVFDIEVPQTAFEGTNQDGTSFDGLGLMFYKPASGSNTFTSINIYLGSDTSYTTDSGFAAATWCSRIIPEIDGRFNNLSPPAGGWNWLYATKADFTQGTPGLLTDPTKTLVTVRISITFTAAGYVDFSSLWWNLPKPKNQLVVTFDDASDTVYTEAFPYMSGKGMVGTVYMCGSLANTKGYLTTEQLNELYYAGWDIANHTYSHLFAVQGNYNTADLVRLWMADVMRNDAWLASNGWHRGRKHFAYPGGDCTPGLHDTALKFNGFLTARTINSGGVGAHHVIGCPNPLQIPARGVTSSSPATDLTDMIDNVYGIGTTLAAYGRSVFWYIHELSNLPGNNYFPVDRFKESIDYAYKMGMQAKSISAWARYAGLE